MKHGIDGISAPKASAKRPKMVMQMAYVNMSLLVEYTQNFKESDDAASEQKSEAYLRRLLPQNDADWKKIDPKYGQTPLHYLLYAIRKGDVAAIVVLRELIQKGVDLPWNEKSLTDDGSETGTTPLFLLMAAVHVATQTRLHFFNNGVSVLNILMSMAKIPSLDWNISLQTGPLSGRTPLYYLLEAALAFPEVLNTTIHEVVGRCLAQKNNFNEEWERLVAMLPPEHKENANTLITKICEQASSNNNLQLVNQNVSPIIQANFKNVSAGEIKTQVNKAKAAQKEDSDVKRFMVYITNNKSSQKVLEPEAFKQLIPHNVSWNIIQTSYGLTPFHALLLGIVDIGVVPRGIRDVVPGAMEVLRELILKGVHLDWNIPIAAEGQIKGVTPLHTLVQAVYKKNAEAAQILSQLIEKNVELQWSIPITGEGLNKNFTPLFTLMLAIHAYNISALWILLSIKDVHLQKWNVRLTTGLHIPKTPLYFLLESALKMPGRINDVLNQVLDHCFSEDPNFHTELERLVPYFVPDKREAVIALVSKNRQMQLRSRLDSVKLPQVYQKATDSIELRKKKKESNKARREVLFDVFLAATASMYPSYRREAAVLYMYGKKVTRADAQLPQNQWIDNVTGSPEAMRHILDTHRQNRKLTKEVEKLKGLQKMKISQIF